MNYSNDFAIQVQVCGKWLTPAPFAHLYKTEAVGALNAIRYMLESQQLRPEALTFYRMIDETTGEQVGKPVGVNPATKEGRRLL